MSNLASAIQALKPKRTFTVIIEEKQPFTVVVEAESEDKAGKIAMEEHNNGNTKAMDDKKAEIVSITD